MNKLILHIPHASTYIPNKEGYCVSTEVLQNEMLKLTDWYTDELFVSEKYIPVIAPFSRLFCDVERFENDADEIMAQVGMGLAYERLDNGEPMRNVPPALREIIVTHYYQKHHDNLTNSVQDELQNNNCCLIVDCHSYPSTPLVRDLDQTSERPDFNIGTDPFHTPQKLIDASVVYFKNLGYSLGVDWPYKGALVPMPFYQKEVKVQAIMLEINRKLYLNEPTNEKSEQFSSIKKVVQGYLEMLRSLD